MNDQVVQFRGTVYEGGYGLIARKVMRDKTLSVKAKAIYAYLCSFASAGEENERSAFPSISLMMAELGIKSEDTFYKFRKELITKGYITIEKRKNEGKFDNNLYFINAVPYPNFSSTEKSSTKKSSTKKQGTINKSTKINNLKSKSTNNHHPIIENFNQQQSNLLHEVIQEQKIDDDLQVKLFTRLQGKNFKHKAYILKALESAKNEVSAAYSSGSTRVVKAPAFITQPNFEHVETYDDLQQKLDKLEDSLNAGTITQEQYEESKDFYMSLYETDDSDEKRAW